MATRHCRLSRGGAGARSAYVLYVLYACLLSIEQVSADRCHAGDVFT